MLKYNSTLNSVCIAYIITTTAKVTKKVTFAMSWNLQEIQIEDNVELKSWTEKHWPQNLQNM